MKFTNFDRRNYPMVSVTEGYGEWAETYEDSVPDLLDIGMLTRVRSVAWREAKECLDLACGTGRIGGWLKGAGVVNVDGIDLTPEMLAKASARNIYRRLIVGSVEASGFSPSSYDLLSMSLVDEHLPSLVPVYQEAARVAATGATFVVVGMHPYFFMTGMPTHFKDKDGNSRALETNVHLASDHVAAAFAAGWRLQEMHEGVIDDEWITVKPKWEKYKGYPVNYGYVWSR